MEDDSTQTLTQLTQVTRACYLNVQGFAIPVLNRLASGANTSLHISDLRLFPNWRGSCLVQGNRCCLAETGANENMNSTVSVVARQQRKNIWLPLLVLLFVLCWGSLTMLVVLQDRMIDAQADVIHAMFKQNNLKATLAAQKTRTTIVRGHGAQGRAPNQSSPQVPAAKNAAPSAQVPSETSAASIPSSQKKLQGRAKPGKNQQNAGKRSPFSRPPAELTDPSDTRRTLFSI